MKIKILKLIFGTTIMFLVLSCGSKETKYSGKQEHINILEVKQEFGYIELLRFTLKIPDSELKEIKSIIVEFREKSRKIQGDERVELINDRNSKLSQFLSPIQMAKKRYIDAKLYNAEVISKKHPLILQEKHSYTDWETLEYIEKNQLVNF